MFNGVNFGEHLKVEHICRGVEEARLAFDKLKPIRGDTVVPKDGLIGWTIPSTEKVKINVDKATLIDR